MPESRRASGRPARLYCRAMRRFLTVLLLLVLPLQLSWAAAASYCQHGGAAEVAGHLGHHAHQHVQGADLAAAEEAPQNGDDKAPCVDDDCAYCHLGCLKTVGAPVMVLDVAPRPAFDTPAVPPIASHIPAGLDRPNWRAH